MPLASAVRTLSTPSARLQRFMTDSVAALSTTETLDLAAELALDTIEFATGNWSTAPHLDLGRLLADEGARANFASAVTTRGLRISALNASGNPLHPATGAEQDRVLCDTIRLARLLDVNTVVCMSGLPAAPGDHTPNWITTCWAPETTEILQAQWDIAIPYWRDLAAFARQQNVQLALEMHANQLVYNAPTLLRLRDAAGPTIGANLDPSHLMWMGSDPISSASALDGAIYHVRQGHPARIRAPGTDVTPRNAAVGAGRRAVLELRHFG